MVEALRKEMIIMFVIFFILILAGAYFVGAIAFPQIIGSIRYRNIRSVGATLFTIFLWVIILIVLTIIAHKFLSDYLIAYYMGMVPPFLMTLGTKNIE